jgi:C2H2 transcription facotor
MTTFQAVNTSLTPVDHIMDHHHDESTTPTTPRPNTTSLPIPRSDESSSVGTFTTENSQSQMSSGIAGQRPLPTSPFPSQSSVESGAGSLSRGSSRRSTQETSEENMDIDDDSDEEQDDSQDGADDGTDGGDSTKLSKKKKPQRFFCTDFPPCTLSFTRSEHLARHIRYAVLHSRYTGYFQVLT